MYYTSAIELQEKYTFAVLKDERNASAGPHCGQAHMLYSSVCRFFLQYCKYIFFFWVRLPVVKYVQPEGMGSLTPFYFLVLADSGPPTPSLFSVFHQGWGIGGRDRMENARDSSNDCTS